MERSEPDDGAWDDPFDGTSSESWALAGEPEYPPAPMPSHERVWRHPSEIGHAAWVQSERSVGLGRGLLITSGAIGCILGLAIVWLMVPAAGNGPIADPSVARSDLAVPTTAARAAPGTTAPPAAAFASTAAATLPIVTASPTLPGSAAPSPLPAGEPTVDEVPSTVATLVLPAENLPTNTVWLKSRAEGAHAAVAVLLGDSPYLITTANAVGSVETVTVMNASGGLTDASVVSVDETFAYIEPDASMLAYGFDESAVAVEGESLTVLADDQIVFTYGDATLASIDPARIAEGTPVVNQDGALVGLCTGGSGTVTLVPIEDGLPDVTEPAEGTSTLPDAQTTDAPEATVATVESSTTILQSQTSAPASTSPTTTTVATTSTTALSTTSAPTASSAPSSRSAPWIGVRLGGVEGSSPLSITAITPGSPAETAGLAIGEEIRAVDGVAVTTVNELVARVEAHAPGDTIVVTLAGAAPAGGAVRPERQVNVVLGQHDRTV